MTTTTNLIELRKLAEAATPGPWDVADGHYPAFKELKGPVFKVSVVMSATDLDFSDYAKRDNDLNYMAAANPANVIELLDTIEAQAKQIEALQEEAEKAKLSRIDRECLQVGKEIQRAAGELPEFYELKVYVERGYGCVYLRNPDGDHKTFDDTVDGLSHCIAKATDAAIASARKGNV